MIFKQDFKDIVIFTPRNIKQAIEDIENRNITNTYEPLLDFIKEFEVEIKDNRLYMYCEDEYEIKMCDAVFYDTKNKSFQIKNNNIYYELRNINKVFNELKSEDKEV